MNKKSDDQTLPSIWNKNFTILTLGTVVSMVGCNLTGFASSLYVYDKTSSTFLYALYGVLNVLPGIIFPLFCGTLLDKFSRRKAIYILDFCSGLVYAAYTLIYFTGHMNYVVIAVGNLVLGSISSVYRVAYESFYPLLVDKRNLSKSYAVSSTLETIVPYVMPLGWFIYRNVGLGVLFIINMSCYLIAAVFELNIKIKEHYVKNEDEAFGLKEYVKTFGEGMRYLAGEKGLLAIVIYFTITCIMECGLGINLLPYFKDNIENGEIMVQILWGCYGIGRIVGGELHYKFKLPAKSKFAIAVGVYTLTGIIEAVILFLNLKVMFVLYFISGVAGMTSYNIRVASTQSYIPDEKKGRFNGTFDMLCSVGQIAGSLVAGGLAEVTSIKMLVLIMMGINVMFVPAIFIPFNKDVKKIYNVDI